MTGQRDFRKLEAALQAVLAGAAMGEDAVGAGSSTGTASAGDNVVPHPAIHDRQTQEDGFQAPLTHPRAFVVMPFGRKKDATGNEIDFDAVYKKLIAPSLRQAGFEPHRADVEPGPGGILADMYQDLLLADLVVADVTIDNPNAWYELGVRHALRPRCTIIIQSGRTSIPFDLGPERIFAYTLREGRPDPEMLLKDRATIARAAMAIWYERERKDSPVFSYLPNLEEPEWRRLRVGRLRDYWDRLDVWERRIEAATQRNEPGDILLLAEEPPVRPLRHEALRKATRALVGLKRYELAIEIAKKALALAPDDIIVRQQKAIAHERLGQFIEARQILEALDQEGGAAANRARGETRGLLGRIAKSEWRANARAADGSWRDNDFTRGLLRQSLRAYASAFRAAPDNYFPAINAVGLSHLYRRITGQNPPGLDLEGLKHGLRWAISCARENAGNDREGRYWLRATEAEFLLLEGNLGEARSTYADAASSATSWFQLESSRQQLLMYKELQFEPEGVNAVLAVLDTALSRYEKPSKTEPKRVVLFSGHMVDHPDRRGPGKAKPERFPASKADAAVAELSGRLKAIGVGPDDVGLCGGACGGDILFAEACLARGMRLHVFIPESEPKFLQSSVNFAGPEWQERFFAVVRRPEVEYRVQTDALGEPPQFGNPPRKIDIYDRNNRWLTYTAIAYGLDRLRVLCLWNQQPGDGPGGTADMIKLVQSFAGIEPVIVDPTNL